MKIYFVGSISGRKDFSSNYEKIISVLHSLGHEVFEHTLNPKEEWVYSLTEKDKEDYYKKVVDWVVKSDVVIAEGSYPSLGVGFEIAQSLEKGKPVIVMYCQGSAPHFLEGLKSEKLEIVKYTDIDVARLLEMALVHAEENIDTRFNFFISPKISNYLDWVAKKKRTPRAVYLRRLIEKAMQDEGFEE